MEPTKNFVIQLQDIADQPILKEYLLAHGAFKRHYDGWEHTMGPNKTVCSTRLYFYNIKKPVQHGAPFAEREGAARDSRPCEHPELHAGCREKSRSAGR